MRKLFFISIALIVLTSCERDLNTTSATLTITNSRTLPIWSLYVAPNATPTERSVDLLASGALDAGASQTFTINTCGQNIDITAYLSDGTELSFSDIAADCGTTITQDIL